MNANINYCGVIILLRKLVASGHCTKKEAAELLPGSQNRPVRTLFFRYKYIQLPLAIPRKVW